MSGHTILCIDDDTHVRKVIERTLEDAGDRCDTAADAHEARRLLALGTYDVVLCDIDLPGESGLDLLAEVARIPEAAAVMVTGNTDPKVADRALELGAYGYLTKPFLSIDLLISVAGAVRRRTLDARRDAAVERAYEAVAFTETELRRAYQETVVRLCRAMGFHDVETGAHVQRVGEAAAAIALELALPEAACERLRLAGPLHDIGKIAISQAILHKPDELSPLERRNMQRHTDVGHELLAGSGNALLELAATIAWTHHEQWDGSGYPRGLAGEAIPLAGRIVAVADVFDALTSDRPYRRAWSYDEALSYVCEQSGRRFDPDVVDAFVRSQALVLEAVSA